jgi:predicted secreted protein
MAVLGNERRCYITTAEGDSYTWLAGEQNNSFNRSAEAIEVSDKSTDWTQFIAGKKNATASVTVFVDDTASAPQHQMLSALHRGTTVYCFIGKLGGTGSQTPSEGDLFEAIVTECSDTNDFGAVATRSISLQVTGEPTHYPTIAD